MTSGSKKCEYEESYWSSGFSYLKKDVSDDQCLESNMYRPLVLWHVVKCEDIQKQNCRRMKIIAGCLPKERLKPLKIYVSI
jgi:hypothetical protein